MARTRPARDLTRQAVLEAARTEFVEKGYYGASLNDVARRAGLTKGAIYSNFPGKRALFIESFLDADRVRLHGTPPQDTDAATALRAIADRRMPNANVTSRRAAALAYELLTLILRDEDEMEVLAEVRALVGFLLARCLELLAIENGAPTNVVLDHVTAAFISVLDGTRLRRSLDESSVPRDVLLRLCDTLAEVEPRHLDPVASDPAPIIDRDPVPIPAVRDEIAGEDVLLEGPVALIGVGRLREVPDLVRRAAIAGRRLTVVVVNSEQHRDMASLVAHWAVDYVELTRVTFPARLQPDLRLAFDVDGTLPAALDMEPTDDLDLGLLAEDGRIVAESLSALAVALDAD